MILFLDYDGVLHPDPCNDAQRLFQHAPRLAHVLADFPEVCVVLSTSWRALRTIDELVSRLPADLAARVVGTTPHIVDFQVPAHLLPYPRHAECLQWLLERGQADRDWLALDDRPYWFKPYCEQLIACNGGTGLTEEVVAYLRSALARNRLRLLSKLDTEL